MKVLNLNVEQVGNEMLVNGIHWMDSKADAQMVEEVIKKMPLEQQWALLMLLKKTVNKVEDNYQRARVAVHEIPASDYERMKRNTSGGRGAGSLPALKAGGKHVPLREVFGMSK